MGRHFGPYMFIDVTVGSSPAAPSPLQVRLMGTPLMRVNWINLSWSATGDEYYGEILGGPSDANLF